jgi:superkiller protein 3
LAVVGASTFVFSVVILSGCAQQKPQTRSAAIDTYVTGVMAYNDGKNDQAIADLQQAVRQHSDLIMAHSMLGDLYQVKRNYNDALAQYEITIRLDPYSYKNHYNEGLMNQLLGRVKEAIAAYLRALELNPKDFLSAENLGAAYLQLDDYDNAIKYCSMATEMNDQEPAAWSNLAMAYEAKGEWKEAENAWRHCLELKGTSVETSVALAKNLKHQQRYAEARAVLSEVVRVSDTASHRKLLGDALFLEKKYDDALDEYARAVKLDARFFPAMNESGWVLITQYNQSLGLEENKRLAALDAWQASLLINPNQPQVRQLMKTYAEKFSDDNK